MDKVTSILFQFSWVFWWISAIRITDNDSLFDFALTLYLGSQPAAETKYSIWNSTSVSWSDCTSTSIYPRMCCVLKVILSIILFKESFKGINSFSIFSFFLEILALCSSDKSV